ncbi:tRNA-dihydrouridine synthase [Candidatus Peregrinibacteria bacterium]|nr:tRNA-dihydrouridine synthase [Candidatus Peregrinibacteria bacterium]
MVFRGFWEKLKKPIIGLSPMDGVTDAAYRYMVCKYSRPDVVITEFTNVEGLARGAVEMLKAFIYDEIERPIVAQIFGVEPESYYKCAVILCELGFDGIDINMGCPCSNVARQGSGAALIKTPDLAKKLIRITKKAVKDWSEGMTMEKADVHTDIISAVDGMKNGRIFERRMIPVSVKTRIGYDNVVAEDWVAQLLEEEPANLTMHGRTLKQLYMGRADWETLAKAAEVVHGSGLDISFLGNGDVKSPEDARKKIADYGVDGVLVGRATQGAPWFFDGKEPDLKQRLNIALEHATYFAKKSGNIFGNSHFFKIRKHLGWYCKGFDGAKELRKNLMTVENVEDVERELAKNF